MEVECEICGSLSYEPSGGLFFCLECGTQSQDVREEITENIETNSFVRTLKAPSTKKKDNSTSKTSRDVTLLEKMQVILQVQCDALISLGFEETVKEAVKYIWFLYLKQHGYAFVEDTNAAVVPASPFATPYRPTVNSSSTSQPLKRTRLDLDDERDDPLPASKRPKMARSRSSPGSASGKGKAAAVFDEFPEDSFLFGGNSSQMQDSVVEGAEDEATQTPVGNDLYLLRRAKRRLKVQFFSVKYSVGVLYLGLLYTHQKILPSDLVRLVATNKIPYYNLHKILPSHLVTSRHSTSIYARNQITADKIHQLSQDLYKSVPLPKLPPVDPKWVCHVLLERLQLPPVFSSLVDKALAGVFWPDTTKFGEHYVDTAKWRERRLDVQCMALIIFIMKLLYRLDDIYEFEQASKAVAGDEASSALGENDYVYVWADWVSLFCRHMQRTLDQDVPLNARELEYVSDYKNFLDFCRLEMLPNVRPKQRPGEGRTGRLHQFDPEYYSRVSDVFSRHLQNLQDKTARERDDHEQNLQDRSAGERDDHERNLEDKIARERDDEQNLQDRSAGEQDDHEQNLQDKTANGQNEHKEADKLYDWDSFTPRLIPISELLREPEHAPWRQYTTIPTTSTADDPKQDFECLSDSMVLLLQLCSDVVDTNVYTLMQHVVHVEWEIIGSPLETSQDSQTVFGSPLAKTLKL